VSYQAVLAAARRGGSVRTTGVVNGRITTGRRRVCATGRGGRCS
jgi:hypothetical protein